MEGLSRKRKSYQGQERIDVASHVTRCMARGRWGAYAPRASVSKYRLILPASSPSPLPDSPTPLFRLSAEEIESFSRLLPRLRQLCLDSIEPRLLVVESLARALELLLGGARTRHGGRRLLLQHLLFLRSRTELRNRALELSTQKLEVTLDVVLIRRTGRRVC
eukprot:889458-Pleurochrysis_carterae.AAC.1